MQPEVKLQSLPQTQIQVPAKRRIQQTLFQVQHQEQVHKQDPQGLETQESARLKETFPKEAEPEEKPTRSPISEPRSSLAKPPM